MGFVDDFVSDSFHLGHLCHAESPTSAVSAVSSLLAGAVDHHLNC